jgi:hypothetical protein
MRKLSLCGGLDHTAVRVLADSGLLARLDALQVNSLSEHGTDAAAVLLDVPATRGLREFGMKWFADDPTILQRLTRTPPFTRLTDLGLFTVRIGDTDPSEFLDWLPPTLTHLSLQRTRLGELAAVSLARSPRIRQLRRLDLSHNRITDAGALTLADSPHLLAPTRLDLTGNRISERVRNALRVRLGHQVVV